MNLNRTKIENNEKYNAVVLFCDSRSFWLLRFLKRGYRHCFIAIKSEQDWIVYEPLLSRTEITIIRNTSLQGVIECFKTMGCSAVPTVLRRETSLNRRLFTLFSCVSAVKRVLGIQRKRILTPYQLHKALQEKS